ncbi:sensor histidine kinase [Butyrivibrio sp. AD3002]|uniref:sensor histidine kinase n=1 Tax=Butyrivibrio sp. AD3002 TaxID=1280670 RepID=UPI0003B4BDC7|nr:histidine kinase [Butyrivibrio sp. AD3002]
MNHTMDYVNIGISSFLLAIVGIKLFGDIHMRKNANKERGQFTKMLISDMLMLISVLAVKIVVCQDFDNDELVLITKIAYSVYFIAFYSLLGFYGIYVSYYISRRCGRKLEMKKFVIPLATIFSIFWVVCLFYGFVVSFDGINFEKGPLYFAGQVGGYLIILLVLVYMIVYRKYLKKDNVIALLSIVFFPLIGVILRAFVPGIEIMPYMICLSLILMDNTFQYEQERLLLEQEDKISRDRIKILLTQIKPHFLYNVLNSIYVLCEKDPEKAQEAIGRFSDYLRGNLSNLEKEDCITFLREMEHVTNYLSLEKMRFREKLTIKYDIKDESFDIPALSVQLLAENAVKHGIHKKEEGGTVRIESYSDSEYYYVIVEDDGVGFNPDEYKEGDGLHIGLDNLRERLLRMCGGHLVVESTPGVGTKSTITIPRGSN